MARRFVQYRLKTREIKSETAKFFVLDDGTRVAKSSANEFTAEQVDAYLAEQRLDESCRTLLRHLVAVTVHVKDRLSTIQYRYAPPFGNTDLQQFKIDLKSGSLPNELREVAGALTDLCERLEEGPHVQG